LISHGSLENAAQSFHQLVSFPSFLFSYQHPYFDKIDQVVERRWGLVVAAEYLLGLVNDNFCGVMQRSWLVMPIILPEIMDSVQLIESFDAPDSPGDEFEEHAAKRPHVLRPWKLTAYVDDELGRRVT
jgi:hypothetical protein